MVALICAFETIPDNEIVGVADILSENVAVIVTTSEWETILSESVSVRVTVGLDKSISSFNFSSEPSDSPLIKLPFTVTKTSVTVVD